MSGQNFYWQYYGLSKDPFAAIPDPTMAITLPKWEYYLDSMQHLIRTENVILTITGAKGMGKSTLLHIFEHQIAQLMQLHHIQANAAFQPRDLVESFAKGFGVEVPAQDTVDEQLDTQINELQYQKKICVLVIDNAEDLVAETLQAILNVIRQQSRNQMRLHILLFGEGELQINLLQLAKQEMNAELIHNISLEALNLEETNYYIQQRLKAAGLQGAHTLTEAIIARIQRESNGAPENINRLTQQALLDEIAQQGHSMRKANSSNQSKLIGGALLALVLVIVAVFLSYNRQQQSPVAPTQQLAQPQQAQTAAITHQTQTFAKAQSQPLQQQPVAPPQATLASAATGVAATAGAALSAQQAPAASTQKTAPPKASQQSPGDRVASLQLKQQAVHTVAQPVSQPVSKLALRKQPKAHKSLPPSTIKKPTPTVKPVSYVVKARPHPVKPAKVKLVHKSGVKKPKTVHHVAAQKIQSVKAAKVIQHPHSNLAEQRAFLQAPGRYYTLQILALSQEKAIRAFIQKNRLQRDTHYFLTFRDGKPWYVLVYGKYKTIAAAHKARVTLPKALRKYKAWPRTFASIKKAMHHAKKGPKGTQSARVKYTGTAKLDK